MPINMQLKRSVVFLIFCSSFAPLAVVVALLHIDWKDFEVKHQPFIIALLVISLLLCVITRAALRQIQEQGGEAIRVLSVQRSEKETMIYILPYLAALISIDITNPSRLSAFLFFIVLISYFAIKNKSVFLNPILAEMGYEAYLIKYSKRTINYDGEELETLALSRKSLLKDKEYMAFRISSNVTIINNSIR